MEDMEKEFEELDGELFDDSPKEKKKEDYQE